MTRPHLTTYVFEISKGDYSLAWGTDLFGPDFDSAEAATSFLAFVARATGLDAHHQSEATLARFHAAWQAQGRK